MHPKNLAIKDFTYHLPDEKIARFPAAERDCSKLLVYEHGQISTGIYRNISEHLPAGSLMIFNNTRVVEARILFQKSTGANIEVFCLEPADQYADITSAMLSKHKVWWKCLIGGASKWKHGLVLQKTVKLANHEGSLNASIVERLPDCFVIEFTWDEDLAFAEVLHLAGVIPLPPYLHRDAEAADKETYQTIYAKQEGSVAAPTAGLHFTDTIFQKLAEKGIVRDFVTLHVGAGTFKPVKAERLEAHEMHSEFIEVTRENIEHLLNHIHSTIIAVGTTSLRTIESLYWIGCKLKKQEILQQQDLQVHQWDPYEQDEKTTAKGALEAVLAYMDKNGTQRIITKTQILIAPGYKLRIAKALVTNFHQPQSTLLLLIAAIVGEKWQEIYQYALSHDFRFLSYGDGCLLWKDASLDE